MPERMKKGEEIILRIESMAFEGKAIARNNGLVVFVRNAVPGDTVRARITGVKRQFIEARTLEVISPSPLRVEPRCAYVGVCGGCKLQEVRYEAQLEFKQRHVKDAFERIGGIAGISIPPTVGADEIFYYRNKMEFSFSDQRWLTAGEIESGEEFSRDFALGLHVAGRFDKVVDIGRCFLQSEISNRILASVREFARERRLMPYSTARHEGFLRFLVVRQSAATGEILVDIVTHAHRPGILGEMTGRLTGDVPEVTTVVNTVNSKKAQVATGEQTHICFGDGTITDRIGGYSFRISAGSFFQTNTRQTERLYSIVGRFADLSKEDIVLDLYCGTGTIGITLSGSVRKVYGIETHPGAIEDAAANAALNGVRNAEFICGDVLEKIRSRTEWLTSDPTLIVLDPPRSGLHPKAVTEIAAMRVPKIVYVSCNPATQARDLAGFTGAGYTIEGVQPVDMFPHTYHIENVVRLTMKDMD